MKKQIGITLAVVGVAACAAIVALTSNKSEEGTSFFQPMDPAEHDFMAFIAHHGRSYGTKEEYYFRLQAFKNTAKRMAEFEAANPNSTSTVGVNLFSDWTPEEYKRLLGARAPAVDEDDYTFLDLETTDIANDIDWRQRGVVTGVKNQGQCGSCWAFSTTGAIESRHAVRVPGNLVSLSEQQLVDCNLNNGGCNGGALENAFAYTNGAPLMQEPQYPYVAVRQGCRYNPSQGALKAYNYHNVPVDNNQLRAAVNQGPVSVLIEADRAVFQGYRGGVLNSGDCGTQLDHAVLAVGYGPGYWIVKNSWTPNWGEGGYVRIADVGGAGICGINLHAVYPDTN